MSWKNIKDHYRIGHIVQVREGKICIGSPYVSDLIKVSFDGEVSWGSLGPSKNDDLASYHAEMTADLAKLRELIAAPDKFEASLPVFTYDGGEIIEKQCEQYDWPNVTHDGDLMYENSFSKDRAKVVQWAKENAAAGVRMAERRIAELKADMEKTEAWRAKDLAYLAKLESASNREGGGGGGFVDHAALPPNFNENNTNQKCEQCGEMNNPVRRHCWACESELSKLMKTTLIAKIVIETPSEWGARNATLEEMVNESIQRNLNAELFGGEMAVTTVTVNREAPLNPNGGDMPHLPAQ